VSFDGAAAITIALTKDELTLNQDDKRMACVARARSAVKEANATSNAQIAAALIGQEFEV